MAPALKRVFLDSLYAALKGRSSTRGSANAEQDAAGAAAVHNSFPAATNMNADGDTVCS
jgi:hypothetical protein